MTRGQRIAAASLCILALAGTLVPQFIGAAVPANAPPAGATKRSQDAIIKDLQTVDGDVHRVLPSLAAIGDEAFRKGDGQKVIPPLRKMTALLNELSSAVPDVETQQAVQDDRLRFLALLAVLGDTDSQKLLEAEAAAKPAEGMEGRVVSAQAALTLMKWLDNGKNAAAQGKTLDEAEALAKANPKSNAVAGALGFMSNVGGADATMSKRAVSIVRANLKSDAASEILADADQKEMIGKLLVLEGRTSTGGKFTSADYKGKVILVDFWATWCGPCIAGLPEVKQVYNDYHPKGLEIVGVSCDSTDDKLNGFTKDNEMTWVQMREESQSGNDQWHPLAKKYGVTGIPTMFLIDKQGVLRFVDAREHLEDGVKQLLAETDKPAQPATQPATQPAPK